MSTATQTQKPVRINKHAKFFLIQFFDAGYSNEQCSEWAKTPIEKVIRYRAEVEAARAEYEASPERQEELRKRSFHNLLYKAADRTITDEKLLEMIDTHIQQWPADADEKEKVMHVRSVAKNINGWEVEEQ